MADLGTPKPSRMNDLIAKLEAASKGSQELDALVIAHLIGGETRYVERAGRWCIYRGENWRTKELRLWSPDRKEEQKWWGFADHNGPTQSLDAALTLVPKGMSVMLDINPEETLCSIHNDSGLIESPDSKNLSPPLALCIAALKARSAK